MSSFFYLTLIIFSKTCGSSPPNSEVLRKLETVDVVRIPRVPSFFNSSWVSPVPNRTAISSPFGPRWKISSNRFDFHRGIDYFDADDTELYAIADGVVFDHRDFVDGGTTTIIEHQLSNPTAVMFHDRQINKVFAYYNHLLRRSTSVGQAVKKGQVIGTMGQTGTTTFTHLHFTTRLVGYCTLQYQVENNRVPTPSSECATGFDPAVHPYLFVGADPREGLRELFEIRPKDETFAFALRYNTTRGHLDLDVIETNLGTVSFNTREGIWGKDTIEGLDDLENITSWMALYPGVFRSTSELIYYEMHFFTKPAFVEVLDIYGEGIRWDKDELPQSTASISSETTSHATTEAPSLSGASGAAGAAASSAFAILKAMQLYIPVARLLPGMIF